jgi:hypothetical protein
MAFTVLRFIFIDFDDSWEHVLGTRGDYHSLKDPAKITLVADSASGDKQTYFFSLKKDSWVRMHDYNVVHIPARCVKKEKGDATTCKG